MSSSIPNGQPTSDQDVFVQDALLADGDDLVTDTGTLAQGQGVLLRGSLLGLVTATGQWKLAASASTDGSQNPGAILIEDTDTTSAAVPAPVYVAGQFNQDQLTFGAGLTADGVRDYLRGRSIYLRKIVGA